MGKELMQEEPAFASSIREMDAVIKSLQHAPDWTLEGNYFYQTPLSTLVLTVIGETLLLDSDVDGSALAATDRAQPVSTALQVALVDLLATWRIYPAAVVGHSR